MGKIYASIEKIPSGYKEVNYLLGINSNDQYPNLYPYINTELVPDENTCIKIEGIIDPDLLIDKKYSYLMGFFYSNNNNYECVIRFYYDTDNSNNECGIIMNGYNGKLEELFFPMPESPIPFSIECIPYTKQIIIIINNVEYEYEFSIKFSSFRAFTLFTWNDSATYSDYNTNIPITSCKIYNYSTPNIYIKNYIPMTDSLNNINGLFDLVNDTFVSSSETNTNFSYGSIKKNSTITKIGYAKEIFNIYISNAIPNDYQELEYIQNDGNHYIDSGYKPTEWTECIGNFGNGLSSSDEEKVLNFFGVKDSINYWISYNSHSNGYKLQSQFNNAAIDVHSTINSSTLTQDFFYIIKRFNNIFSDLEESECGTMLTPSNYTCVNNLFITAINDITNNNILSSSLSIYSFKIYEKDKLVRDFIPCERKIDGTKGLYDKCTNIFYPLQKINSEEQDTTSKGIVISTAYKVSPVRKVYAEINSTAKLIKQFPYIPKEYQQVEYVGCSGNVVLDLNFKGYRGLGYDIDFIQYKNVTTNNYGTIFGGRTNGTVRRYWLGSYNGGIIDYGNATRLQKQGMLKNSRQKFSVRDMYAYRPNNTYEKFSTNANFTTPVNITLFSGNNSSSQIQNGNARIYSLKFYNNYKKQNDYYPCYRLNDGVIGFYDRVTKTFLTKKSGTLTKGNNIIKRL